MTLTMILIVTGALVTVPKDLGRGREESEIVEQNEII